MTIVYDYFGSLYMNLTNKCPCRCEFCIRNQTDGLGTADSLFLDREPSVDEVMAELEKWDPAKYNELVFCGYGEPTERLDDLLEIARRIKAKYGSYIRINTNGLSDLINDCETAPRLKGLIDSVSVSMNEADEEKYLALCHPRYGRGSYDAMIRFLTDVREYVPDVACSVVSSWITEESIERYRQKAQQLGVEFKVR